MNDQLAKLLGWLADARQKSGLTIKKVRFDECCDWHMQSGKFQHKSGKFFSVVGLRAAIASNTDGGIILPMIDQPEVGLLGFLIRQTGCQEIEWLLQAKTEPGNVHGTQIAPSVQATRSNYSQEHGGQPTKFLNHFARDSMFISDAPHSEQGTKFLWKFNRNSVVPLPSANSGDDYENENWRWCRSVTLRQCLSVPFAINTDARSVIASTSWALLAGSQSLFRAPVLQNSYQQRSKPFAAIQNRLKPLAARSAFEWTIVPLSDMKNWTMTDDAILNSSGEEVVNCFAIETRDREVASWCQPFLNQAKLGRFDLYMRIIEGSAQFFVRTYTEIGFGKRKEFGPTMHSDFESPDFLKRLGNKQKRKKLYALDQSDEGGRFMLVKARYRIMLSDDDSKRMNYPFGSWVNLSTLESIVRMPGASTNELRTLASIVLCSEFDETCAQL